MPKKQKHKLKDKTRKSQENSKYLFAVFLEDFELERVLLALADNVDEVVSEHERNSFALEAELFLEVAQNVAEVNVEQLCNKFYRSFH